jgi:hypothetical protein
MDPDEQIEYWLDMMKGITKDDGLSMEQKESDLDDLEEQIKDRLDDSTYNFEDEYIAKVMGKLADLRGLDSLPK